MGETHYGSCPKCGAQLKATPGSTEPPKLCLSCGSPLATGTAGEARRTPPGGGPAIAVAAIGLTALTMALARGFLGESSEDKALASARSQILKLRDEVDVEKAACAKQAEQLTAKASARKLKEEELKEAQAELKKLRESQEAELASLQRRAEDASAKTVELTKAVSRSIARQRRATAARSAVSGFRDHALSSLISIEGAGETTVSGFLFLNGSSGMIVASSDALTRNYGFRMGHRYTSKIGEGIVVHRDAPSRLAFLSAAQPKTVDVRWCPFHFRNIGEARVGEKVFTIGTQVLGNKAQPVTMLEGTVSSTDRRIGRTPIIQTTIPANSGMAGAPLMNQERKLVGVLIGGVEGLERTSIAVPAILIDGAVKRTVEAVKSYALPDDLRTEVQYPRTPSDTTPIYRAAASLPKPYSFEGAIQVRTGNSRFYTGPDDTILVWHDVDNTLEAYRADGPLPTWKYVMPGEPPLAGVYLQPGAPIGRIEHKQKHWWLNLKTGRKIREVPEGMRKYLGLDCGDYCIAGETFVDKRSLDQTEIRILRGHRYIGLAGDKLIVGSARYGKVQACLLPVPKVVEAIKPLVEDERKLRVVKERRKDPRLTTQQQSQLWRMERDLNDRISGMKLLFRQMIEVRTAMPGERRGYRGGYCRHIPSTTMFIVELTVWRVTDTGVSQVGKYIGPRHSAWDQPWFQGYYSRGIQSRSIIAVSPDGKYAMNGLFLFDAVSRRPLIELPVPTMRGGFLSSGRHLYLYDAFGEKIAVFEISQLLKTAKKCSWGRPKWINEK